ncbi:hypothetical protein QJQ45_017586, partial [Haematococcus lacustris]
AHYGPLCAHILAKHKQATVPAKVAYKWLRKDDQSLVDNFFAQAVAAAHAGLLPRNRYPHAHNNKSESAQRCVQPTTLPGAATHAAHAGALPRIRHRHAYNNTAESVQRCVQPTTLPGAATHAAHAGLLPRIRYPHAYNNKSESAQRCVQPMTLPGAAMHAAHAGALPRIRYRHAYNNTAESVQRCVQPMTLPGAAMHAAHAGALPRIRYRHAYNNTAESVQRCVQPMTLPGAAMHAAHAGALPRIRYRHAYNNKSESAQRCVQPMTLPGAAMHAAHAGALPRIRYRHAYNNTAESVQRCAQPMTLPGAAMHAAHAGALPRIRYRHAYNNTAESVQRCVQPMTLPGAAMHAAHAGALPRIRYRHAYNNTAESVQRCFQPMTLPGAAMHAAHAGALPRIRYRHAYNNKSESAQRCAQPMTLPGAAMHAAHAGALPRIRYRHAYNNTAESVQRCVQPMTLPGAAMHAAHAGALPRIRYRHAYNNTAESVQRCVQPMTLPGAAMHAAHAGALPRIRYRHAYNNKAEDGQLHQRVRGGTPRHIQTADTLDTSTMPSYDHGHETLSWMTHIAIAIASIALMRGYPPTPPPPAITPSQSRACLRRHLKKIRRWRAISVGSAYTLYLYLDGSVERHTALMHLSTALTTWQSHGHYTSNPESTSILVYQYNATLQRYTIHKLRINRMPDLPTRMGIPTLLTKLAHCLGVMSPCYSAIYLLYIGWLLLAGGDIEANPGPSHYEEHHPEVNPNPRFFEAQVNRNCQAHSLNNAAGKPWVKPEDLHNFWITWQKTLHDEGDKKAWHTARGDGGAFSDEVIHLYLRYKYGLTIKSVAQLRTTDDWNDDNFDTIAIEYATLNFLCKTNGHSMALRKLGGQWKLLDSDSSSKSAIAICELSHSYTNHFHEVFVIAPDPAATPAQTMATTRQGISHIISHKEDNQNPSHYYMERQYKQCCLVHALNMAMGKPMIRPEDVITHCKALTTHIQDLAKQARQEHRIIPLRSSLPHIYEEPGNFTISTINHYLYHHHKDLHLCPPTTTTYNNNITPELLTTLTGKTDSYTNTAAILITHNHATTIRHINNAWHWLDSERGHPRRLDTPEDWLELHGMLVQIKKGDAADTNLIHPLCWLADPTRRATTEQLEQHLRTTHIDLTTQDLGSQPAHNPRTDRPLPTAQPASYKRIVTATADTHPTDKQARPRLRQVAPTVTLPTLQDRSSSSKRPTSSGTIVDKKRIKPRAQTKDSHTQTLMYRYLNTAPTPPPAAIPTTPPPPTDNLRYPTEHPGPHPQHSTLPTRQPQPTHNRQHITLTTLNVRSLHRSRNDVLNLVHQHSPDILILTETMTQPRSNNPGSGWLKRVMPDYTTHRHRGHSEVLIGIKHNLAIQMQATMLSPSIDAEVNARCVILTLNQHQCEQLTIIATYWPSGSNGEALSLREKMQEHIRTATGHLPGSLILAGDINATMKTEDRSEHTEYTQDSMMRGFATEMQLKEADPGDRAWTYQQPHCNSRIDAILTRDARHGPEHRTHVDTNAYLSDHRPLTAALNTARLGIDLAAPHKPPKHSYTILTTPVTNKDREAYRLAVQQPSSGVPQLHAELTAFLAPIYTEATHHLATLDKTNPQQPQRLTSVAGRPAREAVDTAATMLTHLLQTCRTAALKTCNTKTLTRGGQHYQRRTMCRIRQALGKKLKTTRELSRKARVFFKQNNVHPTIDELVPETDTTNAETREAVQARQGEDPTENHVQAALARLTNSYRDQIHQLDDDDSALAIAQARARMQQLISTQPKKANKRILRPSRTDHKGLHALADPDTKTICTAPADLNRIITAAYGQKLSAPTPKTGHYITTQTRNYPWARAKADDAFALHACQNIHWLHTAIMDKAGFQECLSRLAGGKAPGPDGVENEIIKMLPWEIRDTIHQLFIIMWATGCTPTTWKTSDTCLLYKDKGQETDLNAYRPVGLANTVYKLWTSLITKTLSEYAEANGMLSKNQAGFRSHRNTTQQLQMLVMALEDAKLAKADIYALLVDFTSAFNTTCQDKLLWIMHYLGFPTDATDAVKDLYTGATTRFKTPYGHTDPVPVNRGTIQGDSLSPFLFLIYIEPLLRWLQVGARGYKFKSATADSGARATVSSIDYADDIAILCNTLRNLRCQADKLSAFSDWGHLIISHSKTLATAALHHSVETGMCSNAAEADKRASQQLRTVSLQGKPVTYHRPTSPFTYLGVLITMTLDWKPQHTAMITQLRQKLERLRRSFASARQAIHIIRTAVIPSLAYSFCAVPCTPGDLELYDRSINQCVKLKLRLPLGTPNAIIREDAGKLGIGISSTAQEYHARNTTALTHSLQSTDVAHAHISRSMLHKQITWLSTQASTQGHRILTLLHHTLRARQLVYASISGLSATEEGLPLYHEECQTLGRLITQASSSQAHDVVSASITCLKSLGITHASELSCKGNTHIITGNMLTSKYGKKVKQKHIIALNKLAAMAAQPSCPDATATRAIRDSRNTSLDLPPDQRKITPWAAGLTELAPTPAVPDTRARYMDMKAYAVMHATQPATADRAAAAPAVHEAIRTSSRLLKREQRATKSAPTKPNPPKAGTKRNNEGRQTQTIPQDIVRIVGLDLPGLSSWKVDKACRCKSKNLGCILGAMYGHQEAITSIDGWQWDGINKENYYKVHWKPTVIDRWALPLCAEEGYTPTHIETISREEAKDVCTCELCWLPRGDSPTCHNCKRAYHPACLDEAHLSGHKEPGYWLCPICKFGSNDFKTTMRQSAHSDLIRVHWHPTLEPAPLITAHLDYMEKRNDYDEENRQIQEARHARPDAHLPAHTRQGLPDPHTWLPRCNNLHSKATFHTYPINPQTDIVGTGNCETFLQLHPHMTAPAMSLSTGEPIMPRHDLVQHVTVHDESGRTVGLLTKDQHQHLHAWLQHTPHTRNLATEVVALLRRQDAQSSHHPMRGAQDKALNTLHTTRSFPSTVQRWADPLTVRPETTTYWSPDTNDTAFGAHHNCLLVRHTGLSTWNVPADDAVALKCVNHAIHSATQEEAMATIMLIPGKKGISYPKHIDTLRRYPEYCQHLASIPPTKTRCPKPGKHAKLHIYVIWNAAGQQLVTKGNPQGWLASTATALHPQRDTHPIRNRPTNQSQPATPPSGHKQHMRLPLDRDLPTSGHQRSHEQLTHHSTTQPRMAITEWATIAYTDGSCIKTSGAAPESVGAGVYIPENNVLITAALNDPESKTINRAELTAIHAALKAGAKRIATDSLCSLYQIRRALANPMSLITHRHNDILTAIATLIIDSPATIHFYKVRAHSGIIGNEGADALAKYAALHPELANTPAYSPTTRNETKNWLSNETDGESPAPLPDCRQSVRAHMHRKHKLGLANQDSIYYQMTQEITKAAAKGAGERVMIDTNISTHAQRTALLYRTGGLYNQKLAMRWKRATDDRCPLCGEADSATHLLSGCSETLPMVQERHNGAGRLITKAISKGTLGGYISFADTGSWEKGAKESLDLPSDTLHTTLQTLGLKPEDTKHTTRPDILMVLPHKKASKDGKDTKRMSQPELLEMRKHVAAFLEQGIIKPSSSPCAAPVIFVINKSKKRLLEGEEAGVVQPAQPAIQQPQQEPQPQLVLEQPLPPPPLPVHPLHAVNMTEQLLAAYAADEAFASTVDQYDLDKHGLYRTKGKNQIVVPNRQQLKARILVEMHDAQFAGHVGITKTLERISRIFWWPRMRSESDWPFFLSLAEFAVNNSWQESIQSTPFLVNTGQSPLTPALLELPGEVYCPSARKLSEWWQSNVKQARHFIEQAQQRQAYLANKGRRDVEFSPGQLVLLSTKNLMLKPGKAKKLLPRFIGPFKVLEHVGPVAVRLDLPPAMARMHPVFHVALLRPYTSEHPHLPPPVDWLDEAPLYEVEKLLAHRGVRAGRARGYLVKWLGYDDSYNTWEPRNNLVNCQEVLTAYNAVHGLF